MVTEDALLFLVISDRKSPFPFLFSHVNLKHNCRFSRDVTATMLLYRTIEKKSFWEFDSVIMQNFSIILPLFYTPTWPSHHVSENQEFLVFTHVMRRPCWMLLKFCIIIESNSQKNFFAIVLYTNMGAVTSRKKVLLLGVIP